MTFTIKEDGFYLNESKVFLNSGEIHYFRIKRDLWARHLMAAREAGLKVISTYVPWAWHEEEESRFDFDGETCPERDLKGWLKLCRDSDLLCILKPGPFILAEFRGAGLPDWFMGSYADEVKMRNSRGEIVQSDGVSLFNKRFLEKVTLWYDRIMPLIAEHQLSAGGPVIMIQICNEIGVFSWLAKQADYGNAVRERFITYLSAKYGSVNELNSLWGTGYSDFAGVELPPDGMTPYSSRGDRGRDYEWHCFWRRYYGDYLRMLTSMARERGVNVPLYHNLPGWIYGHGYEFPVNITMYDDLYDDRSEIVFGVDHIPEFLSHRNMHDDRIINDITSAMQGKKPLFAAEFQSGSREYHVVTNSREMELFYKASIANGLTGWNYYMFSQGRNPSRKGYSGDTFYWYTPLTASGERTNAFPLVQRMSRIAETCGNVFVTARRKAEICVLFYPPYYATETERPVSSACELQFVPSAIRRPAWFDGLLRALQLMNIDYDIVDLTRASCDSLKRYRQVWAFCTDEMNASHQQTLADYMRSGGNVVIYPFLPDREMSQKDCTIIRDALAVSPSGKDTIDSPLVDIYDFKDIKCANPQITYSEAALADAVVIAKNVRGNVCGFSKPVGHGSVIHLGTWLGFDTEGHLPVYESILEKSGARLRQASAGNSSLTVRERFTEDNSAVLFVGNYFNEEQRGKVVYTHPATGDEISIPYSGEEILWPPLYGVLTPLCLGISDGLMLLHTTSDVLNIEEGKGQIEIVLHGDRDLHGEIVFEGPGVKRIRAAAISGKSAGILRDGSRIILTYSHEHRKEITLYLKIS